MKHWLVLRLRQAYALLAIIELNPPSLSLGLKLQKIAGLSELPLY